MNLIKLTFLFSILFIGHEVFTQGCNDAGLCTLGDFGSTNEKNIRKYQNELSYSLGLGEQQTIIQAIQFDQKFLILNNKLQINLRVPFSYVYGNLAQTYGVGDISLGLSYLIPHEAKSRFSIFLEQNCPQMMPANHWMGKAFRWFTKQVWEPTT